MRRTYRDRDLMRALGERARHLRESRRLTYREASKLIGVSHTALFTLENARRAPTVETIIKVARAYEVSVDELLGLAAPDVAVFRERDRERRSRIRALAAQIAEVASE